MIRSLTARVRGWSLFVKLMVIMSSVVFVTDLLTGKGFSSAYGNILFGVTLIVVGEYLAPPVIGALFCRLHDRMGMESPCGSPEPPTAADWHHAVVAMVVAYTFITTSLAVMGGNFSLSVSLWAGLVWAGVSFMAPWIGLSLLAIAILEGVHFLGHYRAHRREMIAREQAREAAKTEQAFWEMVRHHKPDPGSVA